MENKLKVGQSVRVFQILNHGGYEDEVTVGSQFICDEACPQIIKGVDLMCYYNHGKLDSLHFYQHEVKLIGKLTITKLK